MIHGLSDLNKDKDKEEKKKKTTDFYTGGHSSGLAVSSPDVNSILSKASKESKAEAGEVNITVTLYSNGFIVNDGPLRNYTDPDSQAFMAQLNQNRVPQELTSITKGKACAVSLQDKRGEAYTPPPPPAYIAFSGQGQSASRTTTQPAGTVNLNLPDPDFNANLPTTTIQIRFHNGQRKNITVNLGSPIQLLFDYVMYAAPVNGPFHLVSGFPPKPLENLWDTVEDAGIAGSAVIQKLV